jgi:hypothetical protein
MLVQGASTAARRVDLRLSSSVAFSSNGSVGIGGLCAWRQYSQHAIHLQAIIVIVIVVTFHVRGR